MEQFLLSMKKSLTILELIDLNYETCTIAQYSCVKTVKIFIININLYSVLYCWEDFSIEITNSLRRKYNLRNDYFRY